MCLLIWTVFSGERCGPWASCYRYLAGLPDTSVAVIWIMYMYILLQHLQVTKPGLNMNFFVIGAANFADRSNQHAKNVPSGSSKFFWAKEMDLGGFAYMEIMKQNATFTFIDGVGKNLYQKMLFPRMSSSYNWMKCRLLL